MFSEVSRSDVSSFTGNTSQPRFGLPIETLRANSVALSLPFSRLLGRFWSVDDSGLGRLLNRRFGHFGRLLCRFYCAANMGSAAVFLELAFRLIS